MSKTMQAAVLHKFGQPLEIKNVPIPEINAKQILVKITASGVCHTDLHAITGDWPVKPKLPLIPGHEGVGIITKVGKEVIYLKEGDRVGIPWLHRACGFCEHCLTGWEQLCEKQTNTGYSVPGCHAEYVTAYPNYVVLLPTELSDTDWASQMCAGLTVYRGLKETGAKADNWIVIYGVGGLGHLAIQYAKAMGLNVIAIDVKEPQLKLAKELKADILINATLVDPVMRVKKEIKGAHAVLSTAVTTDALTKGSAMLRRHGTLVVLGIPPNDFKLTPFDMVINHKTVRGSIVGSRMDLRDCLNFAAEGKVSVFYTTEKLKNINKVFAKLKTGKVQGRYVIKM